MFCKIYQHLPENFLTAQYTSRIENQQIDQQRIFLPTKDIILEDKSYLFLYVVPQFVWLFDKTSTDGERERERDAETLIF